ncbi:MAG: hypothetical protein J3K34DRAFT_498662 [Monoraphidium minutum]|nr:MAG: hypothetical protein J3K34DRAFT_498662 [Monoraphidium minutum]
MAAADSSVAAAPPEPLTDADLRRYIDANGLQASMAAGSPEGLNGLANYLADGDVIKSLVFSADGQPVLVVDERKLARHLGVSRRRVRLASTEDALQHSGYAVGTVPPFGHRHPLRTLLDAGVTRRAAPGVWAGGGHPDIELQVDVSELLAHTRPEVGDFCVGGGGGGADSEGSSSGGGSSLESGEWGGEGGGGAALPLPWAAGSDVVRLVGVVALRRRVAKTLLFATLVPECAAPPPPDGRAAFLRRVWRHPEDGGAAEVQLIVGKTVERALGRDAAIALMDATKVGCVVAVTGRVQPHPRGAAAAAAGGGGGRALDVVAHSLHVLHKSGDALAGALRRAARGTGLELRTAAELDQMRWLGPAAFAAAYPPGRGAAGGGEGGADGGAPPQRQGGAGAPAGGGGEGGNGPAMAAAAAPPQYWQLPVAMERVHDVADLPGLEMVRRAIFGRLAPAAVAGGSGSGGDDDSGGGGGGSGGGAAPVVVGLDVEWQPFGRGEPHTPAALLQLALRDDAFLLDLPALCRRSPLQRGLQPSEGGPATEAALSALLADLFGSADIIKVGFYLKQDLQRVRESYPWLPVFAPAEGGGGGAKSSGGGAESSGGGGGGAPLEMHVDLIELVRAALPRMGTLGGVSLTRLAAQLLGAPLDKRPQLSDWGARPLSGGQRAYAAGDALVLVALFDELARRAPGAAGRGQLAALHGGLRRVPATAAGAQQEYGGGAQQQLLYAAPYTGDGAAGASQPDWPYPGPDAAGQQYGPQQQQQQQQQPYAAPYLGPDAAAQQYGPQQPFGAAPYPAAAPQPYGYTHDGGAAQEYDEGGGADEPISPVYEATYDANCQNALAITGNIGRDPVLSRAGSSSVAKTTLAVKIGSGKEPKTSWFELEMWPPLAELAATQIRKGMCVVVHGTVRVDEYVDKNSQKRIACRIVAKTVGIINRPAGLSEGAPAPAQQYGAPAAFGQQPLGQQPLGQQPLGQQPLGQQPLMAAPRPQQQQQQQPAYPQQQQQPAPQLQSGGGFPQQAPRGQQPPPTGAGPLPPLPRPEDVARDQHASMWLEFVMDPSKWWDNRARKVQGTIKSNSPDFSEKEAQAGSDKKRALWLVDKRGTPAWALARLPPQLN